MILPPGTILQLLYLKERLRGRAPGRFIEIGVGQGYISACLLQLGWQGTGVEVDAVSAEMARRNNSDAISRGFYRVITASWLELSAELLQMDEGADLIISSMVLEHLDENSEVEYFARCRRWLRPDGLCAVLVPGSPLDWGIEDEIAGHYRRYTYGRFHELLPRLGWKVKHIAGLTFPLSNVLLPLSNFLVSRAEAKKLSHDFDARTRASGRREVYGKTVFPAIASLLLNEWLLYPLHVLQKMFSNARRALVIYAECVPAEPDGHHR